MYFHTSSNYSCLEYGLAELEYLPYPLIILSKLRSQDLTILSSLFENWDATRLVSVTQQLLFLQRRHSSWAGSCPWHRHEPQQVTWSAVYFSSGKQQLKGIACLHCICYLFLARMSFVPVWTSCAKVCTV